MTQGNTGAAAGGQGPRQDSKLPGDGRGRNSPDGAPAKIVTSQELMGDAREILILHNDQMYRLRKTRQGKLVLCK